MPFVRSKPQLELSKDQRETLTRVAQSRTDQARRVERARLLLELADQRTPNEIAAECNIQPVKVYRLLNKALEIGPIAALDDLQRSGRPPQITADARAWITSIACQKPKDLGYAYELWTTRLLSQHVRKHAQEAGHPSVVMIGSGTISRLFSEQDIKPHKVSYYLERRNLEFEEKMVNISVMESQQVNKCEPRC